MLSSTRLSRRQFLVACGAVGASTALIACAPAAPAAPAGGGEAASSDAAASTRLPAKLVALPSDPVRHPQRLCR